MICCAFVALFHIESERHTHASYAATYKSLTSVSRDYYYAGGHIHTLRKAALQTYWNRVRHRLPTIVSGAARTTPSVNTSVCRRSENVPSRVFALIRLNPSFIFCLVFLITSHQLIHAAVPAAIRVTESLRSTQTELLKSPRNVSFCCSVNLDGTCLAFTILSAKWSGKIDDRYLWRCQRGYKLSQLLMLSAAFVDFALFQCFFLQRWALMSAPYWLLHSHTMRWQVRIIYSFETVE